MRRPSLSNFGGSGRVEARDLRRTCLDVNVEGAVRRAVAAWGSCGVEVCEFSLLVVIGGEGREEEVEDEGAEF